MTNGDKRRERKGRVSFRNRQAAYEELKRVLETGKKTLARSKEVIEHMERAANPKQRRHDDE